MIVTLLTVENLGFRYRRQQPLVERLSFSVREGLHYVVGPNACGKSTLIRILCGVQRGFEGAVRLNGLCPVRDFRVYVEQVSYTPAESAFSPALSAQDLFGFILRYRRSTDKHRLQCLCERFAVEGLLEQPLQRLSTGSLKKVMLISALMIPAGLYLFDEPFMGLDAASVALFRQCLDELRQSIVLVVAHEYSIQSADTAAGVIDFRSLSQAL